MKDNLSTEVKYISNEKGIHSFYLDEISGYYIQKSEDFKSASNLFSLVSLPKDGAPISCTSSFISILFCRGDATISIAQQKIHCFSGNILLLGQECNFVVEPKVGTEVYLALYKKELFDNLFLSQIADCPIIYDFFLLKNHKDEFLYFDCNHKMDIQYFVHVLQLELCRTDHLSDKTVRCATVLFLSNLHRIHRPNLVISESSMMKEYIIGNILKYMADNYSTATLSNTAAHFNYHPAYFSEMFQRKAHCSFSKKMLEIRMEQACRLLISTNITIHQICEMIGFQDNSYFYRRFKKIYGITPGQYRKSFQFK